MKYILAGLLCLTNVCAAYVVMLDAGHGGKDPGATGIDGLVEKNVCLMFSKDLTQALERYDDIKVIQTRKQDVYLRLGQRISIARTHPIDLFISLHMDKGSKPSYRGISLYVQSKESAIHTIHNYLNVPKEKDLLMDVPAIHKKTLLSMVMQSSLDESVLLAKNVLKSLSLKGYVLHNPQPIYRELYLFHQHVPNLLIELGYISNADDVAIMLDSEKRIELARVLAATIYAYLADGVK